jgi:hypothetical protein
MAGFMRKLFTPFIFIAFLFVARPAFAQSPILYVAPGETMFVSVADTLHTYGLGLTPNVTLNLSDISVYRTTSLTNPNLSPAIQRAFRFTSVLSFSGMYKFWYTVGELNGITETDLKLFYYTSSWNVAPTANHELVEKVMSSEAVNILPIELTLAPISGSLPVTWLEVAAILKGKDAVVKWKTAAESNLEAYTVMHSLNGINWTAIGTALPKGGVENQYEHLHINPPTGKNYYRIKAKELTGEMKFSKVVFVNINGNTELGIYPNPSAHQQAAVLQVGKAGVIQIWRANGSLVSSTYYPAGTHTINPAGLIPGVYLVSDGQKVITWILK